MRSAANESSRTSDEVQAVSSLTAKTRGLPPIENYPVALCCHLARSVERTLPLDIMHTSRQSGWSIIDLFWFIAAVLLGYFLAKWLSRRFGLLGNIGGFVAGFAVLPILFRWLRRGDVRVITPSKGGETHANNKHDASHEG
ncbi:MAG: hypothetical protein HY300_17825 [Verrucomicrobia bacterium]|nr:hypothetical protein [Verrucomicrobiota bacterium]